VKKKEEEVGATNYFVKLAIESFLKTKMVIERLRQNINWQARA